MPESVALGKIVEHGEPELNGAPKAAIRSVPTDTDPTQRESRFTSHHAGPARVARLVFQAARLQPPSATSDSPAGLLARGSNCPEQSSGLPPDGGGAGVRLKKRTNKR
jgi:hypothetical protein